MSYQKKVSSYEKIVSELLRENIIKTAQVTIDHEDTDGNKIRLKGDLKKFLYNPEILESLILFIINSDKFEYSKKRKYSKLFIEAVHELVDDVIPETTKKYWMGYFPHRMADIICYADKFNDFYWPDYEFIGYALMFTIHSSNVFKDCLLKKIVQKLNKDSKFYKALTKKVYDYWADEYTVPVLRIFRELNEKEELNERNINLIRNLIYILYTNTAGNSNIKTIFEIKKLSWSDVYEFLKNYFLSGRTEIKSHAVFYKDILYYLFIMLKNDPDTLLKFIDDLPRFEVTEGLIMLGKEYKDKKLISKVFEKLLGRYFDHQISLEANERLKIYKFMYESGSDKDMLKKFLSKEVRSGKIVEFKKEIKL